MIDLYEKDIRIIQNDDMPNSFELNYKDFGVSYHLGYSNEANFDFYFSNTRGYKLFSKKAISMSPNKVIEYLHTIKPSLAEGLNVEDDINIYGEKQLTRKDKDILRHIYVILFISQINKLIKNDMHKYLGEDIMEFYLHLISHEEISHVLNKSIYNEDTLNNFDLNSLI